MAVVAKMVSNPLKKPHNIVLFGETGCGKSSVINMLRGVDPSQSSSGRARVSATAIGCTLSSTGYPGNINGESFTFWDTIGLNEGDEGEIPDIHAVASLYHLLRHLEDGVSLLVFCMRAPRITSAGQKNWSCFRDIICQGNVPIVIAITHLEMEDMDEWWPANENAFRKYGINPSEAIYRSLDQPLGTAANNTRGTGVACITATKGKLRKGEYIFEEEYGESCVKIRELIYESHLPTPWKVERVKWFQEVVHEAREGWLCSKKVRTWRKYVSGQGIFELLARWGLQDEEEATRVAQILEGRSIMNREDFI